MLKNWSIPPVGDGGGRKHKDASLLKGFLLRLPQDQEETVGKAPEEHFKPLPMIELLD